MELSSSVCRTCHYCVWIGTGLMSLALFLHPMSPDDFLALALSAPLETLRHAYGRQAAVLFWISVPAVALGMLGLVYGIRLICWRVASSIRLLRHRLQVKTADTEEHWSFL